MAEAHDSRIPVVICAFFLVVGVLAVVGTWAAYFKDAAIERSGVVAEGLVLKKDIVRSADGDSDYRLAYRFPLPSGEMMQTERNVPKRVWNAAQTGSAIQISYAADDPRRNFPVGAGVTSVASPIAVSIMFGGLALFGGVVLYRMYRPRSARES
jgi:hypothetical protein